MMRVSTLIVAAVALLGCGDSGNLSGGGARAGDPGGGDWPMWGHTTARNMVSDAGNLPLHFEPGKLKPDGTVDLTTAKNIFWVAQMGSQTYGNPAVSNGRIFIGTNNEGRGDPRFKGDYSRLLCLDTATGKEIWTLTVPKLGTGKVGDWEFLGICSHPTVVGNRVYVMTNRCELTCLDVNGLADGNQGEQDEGEYMSYVGTTPGKQPIEVKPNDADIIWRFNLIHELGVYPHNITGGSPLVVGDVIFCNSSNGVTYDHTDIPSPKAPALVALNRKTAERSGVSPAEVLVGEEALGISKRIFHGAWTGPAWAEIDGKGLVIYGGPDGVLYAFDPKPVKDADGFGILQKKWSYDCVPRDLRYRNGDAKQPIKYASNNDGPSELLATPVIYKGRVYVPIGQDPEHREGPGNFSCVDIATGKKVWDRRINRSLSTCAVSEDLVYAADFSGWLYCMDANTGALHWKFDGQSQIWCSPLVADHKVYMGDNDGKLTIFITDRMKKLAEELGGDLEILANNGTLVLKKGGKAIRTLAKEEAAHCFNQIEFPAPINCSPIVAQGVLYIATMRHLYAIKEGGH
jgi:outer membrane protein assembly factor BamB